jgi:hypothetical protein
VRLPVVAGQFYDGTKESLLKQIEWCYRHPQGPGTIAQAKLGPRNVLGLVSPHAGYMYSGPVAAHGFACLAEDGMPKSVVIVSPNHTGTGSGVSIMLSGSWKTPLGEVKIDQELAEAILKSSEIIDRDEEAHACEHSIEVQLPFLQHLSRNFTFVPITMMLQDGRTSVEVGEAISRASVKKDVLVIASTDFTHYESQNSAAKKDRKAIDKILSLDGSGLLQVVEEEAISMCGYGPVVAMLQASKNLGAKKAKLLKYATSGETAGPMTQVVGYGSIAVLR